MKPLQLTIKGLKSFSEAQVIDFETLTQAGIFGIFGPTGSGKTTILDAMIFALYGTTSIGKEAIHVNDTTAFVSFTFALANQRYQVERDLRLKGTGKPKLIQLETQTVLAEGATDVTQTCQTLLGLNADEFKRTVVLPQGKFSELLTLKPAERAKMLENLFRLDEYGDRLNQKLQAKKNFYQHDFTELHGEYNVYAEIQADDVQKFESQLTTLTQLQTTFAHEESQLQTKLKTAETVAAITQELKSLQQDAVDLAQQGNEIVILEQKIQRAEEAKYIYPSVKKQHQLIEDVNAIQLVVAQANNELDQTQQKQQQINSALQSLESAYQQLVPWEIESTNLAAQINKAKELPALEAARRQAHLQLQSQQQVINDITTKGKMARERHQHQQGQYQQLQQQHELLQAKIGQSQVITEATRLASSVNATNEVVQALETKLVSACQKLAITWVGQEAELTRAFEQQLQAAHQQRDQIQTELTALRQKLAHQELAKWQQQLQAGDPCPVCGSRTHDLQQAVTIVVDASLNSQIQNAEVTLTQAMKAEEQLKIHYKHALDLLPEYATAREKLQFEQEQLQSYLGAHQLERHELAAKAAQLHDHWQAFETSSQQLKTSEAQLNQAFQAVSQYEQQYRDQTANLQVAQQAAALAEQAFTLATEQLQTTASLPELEQQLQALQAKITSTRESYERLQGEQKNAEEQVNKAKETQTIHKARFLSLSDQLHTESEHIQSLIATSPFNTADAVLEAYLPDHELLAGRERIEAYQKKRETITQRTAELELQRATLPETTLPVAQLEQELVALKQKNAENERELGSIATQITTLKAKLVRKKELAQQLKQLEEKLETIKELENLFRGRAFIKYVAHQQLAHVCAYASEQLTTITNGAYHLELSDKEEFIIRDFKNGGQIRNVATLSGGETFLVSLALALALSTQIQLGNAAPLEFFFLDEGFGTLDEQLLETVMDSLEQLHHEKLTIGLISHVEAIKQRMPVKLIVTPAQAGNGGSKTRIEYS